jgi:hypothetical protein
MINHLSLSIASSVSRIVAGCDIEPCPHCGWSALGCAHFHGDDPRRDMWNGKWPGEEDCERLGFYSNGDPDFLNRLFTDWVWDADAQRWERRPEANEQPNPRARPNGAVKKPSRRSG